MAPVVKVFKALYTLISLTLPVVFLAQNVASQDAAPLYGDGNAPDVVVDTSADAATFHGLAIEAEVEGSLPDLTFDTASTGTELSAPASVGIDRRADGAADFFLRIMPLGASITQGYASTDGNGYRKHLRDRLRFAGWKVNMVGSQQTGSMADKDNEGHPGWVISTVHDAFAQSKGMKPNLVLLNVGTNDCGGNIDTANAGSRLKALMDDIYASIPGVTVIMSTVLPNRNPEVQACAVVVSDQYMDLYHNYKSAGVRVEMADMQNAMVIDDIRGDQTHPTDAGYKKMASVWWDAFQKISGGLLPPDSSAMNDALQTTAATCPKVAGNSPPGVQIQQGSGADDGLYVHTAIGHGVVQTIFKSDNTRINEATPWHIFFAQLINGGGDRSAALEELIRIKHWDDGTNTYYFRHNNGAGSFEGPVAFDVGINCNTGPNYWFADFNNDGLDDFYCLGANAEVHVALNRGGNPPKFESIGQVMGPQAGYNAGDIRIADIDGDGRADYCIIAASGAILCSRNGGQGDNYFWQGFSTAGGLLGEVFPSQGKPTKAGVWLGDINGDFRADYMYIGDNGNVETWINQRGWGSGMVPYWTHIGITHAGQGIPGVQSLIKFGRLYGSGSLDYVYLKNETDRFEAIVYENKGSGGTRMKGDGTFYCDMRGTGSADYVWIYNDGQHAQIFENIHAPPLWGQNSQNLFSVQGPREGIHLADWDGDGKCDVLTQDKATGALHFWKNNYDPQTDKFAFTDQGIVAGPTCSQGWGVGIFDRGLVLTDVDGDGRADYLCMEPNGRVTGWLNPITGLHNVGQIKLSEGFDRANIRFADVEKSGRSDLIWVDKYTGASTVFKNLGPTPASGSAFTWQNRGVLYAPIDRGANMHFANIGGLGRADLIKVLPLSNRAWVLYNQCGSSGGGDDGPIVDPGLPPYTSPPADGSGTGDADDYDNTDDATDTLPDTTALPGCTKTYTTFESLNADLGTMPDNCRFQYTFQVLDATLDAAMKNYTEMMADHYDSKFQTYAKAVVDHASEAVSDFYNQHGNDYFTCVMSEFQICCSYCNEISPSEPDRCRYCFDDGCYLDKRYAIGGHSQRDEVGGNPGTLKKSYTNVSEPCPPDYSKRGYTTTNPYTGTTFWTLRSDKEARFYADLATETGITSDNIAWGNINHYACDPTDSFQECLDDGEWDINVPKPHGYDKSDVGNPKDTVSKALANGQTISPQIKTVLKEMSLGMYFGDGADLIDALAIPVAMIAEGTTSMQQIIDTADKIDAAKRKAILMAFLGAVLFLVPVAGEVLGTIAELANIGRIIALIGEAANVADDVATIVKDDKNAPLAIFGVILAPLALTDLVALSKAAGYKRAMSTSDVAKLGTNVGAKMAVINKVTSPCRK